MKAIPIRTNAAVIPSEYAANRTIPRTTVREQAGILVKMLRTARRASFGELSVGCEDTYEVVARFLAVLDLYRDKCVSFEQQTPLGELYITWIAQEAADGDRAADPEPGQPGGAHDDGQR